jgi:hypothetical protein
LLTRSSSPGLFETLARDSCSGIGSLTSIVAKEAGVVQSESALEWDPLLGATGLEATKLRVVLLSRYAVQQELSQRDGLDIATSCAALELLPANASHLDRLCALSATALSLGASGGPLATTDDLARWLIVGPTLHVGAPWDPYEGPFAEPINFYGGGYLLQTGGNAEAVFNLRTLLSAVFAPAEPLGGRDFAGRLSRFARSVLALATYACTVGHVPRWASADTTESILIPSAAAMKFLSAGVHFTREELRAIIGADPEALDPIVHDLDALGPPSPHVNGTQFNVHPLLRRGDTYVMVEPGALALALRHAIIRLALAQGLRSELVERLAMASIVEATATGERMRWTFQREVAATDAPIVSLVGGFDTDKAFDIAIVYEDFEGYSDSDPERSWDLARWEPALADHLRAVEERLIFGVGERPNEILHLIVIAGCGRPYALGVRRDVVRMPQLPLSLENFHQIGMASLDPLRLWKFAYAGERLRTYCRTFSFSILDEYGAWSDTESFYFGDDGRPTFVSFDPSHGRGHREKVTRDTDVHGVISPRGSWTEVVRLHEAPHIPIYGVLNDLGSEALMLVEGTPIDIWVKATDVAQDGRAAYFDLVDCVAYWLWQMAPSLPDLALVGAPRLIVEVTLSDPGAWTAAIPVASGEPVAEANSSVKGVLRVTINPPMMAMLDRPDNAAERALVEIVLEGLDSLIPESSRLGSVAIAEAVDRHAPLGIKRKINVLRAENDIALLGDGLPRYRRISRADIEWTLDDAGEHLAAMNLPFGAIPSGTKTDVLNSVVTFHFAQLESEVSQLSPAGLLERLIGLHEAILHHEAIERRTFGARVAAFGDTELIKEMRRALPDVTQASVALRFLIEYVAARPPRGLRPFSIAGYDQLLAIASQIASRGMTSDIVHFEIDDPELSYLASRRLGLSDTGRFQKGQRSFLDAMIPAHVRSLVDSYGAPWRSAPKTEPPEIAEIDRASTAEWGFSMTELLEVFSVLSAIAHDHGGVAVSMSATELQTRLARELKWPDDRTSDAIRLLTLRPRLDFTTPPPGFRRYDTWPWRFNRSLSYMRRPLLLRPSSDGNHLVWGMRQPEQAGRFLVDLITSERLNARSGEMKKLMTRLRQAETATFVERVADVCRDHGMLVDTSVWAVGGAKIARANGDDLGDVDVLAVDTIRSTIYALECKDLEIARTPAELDNELVNTFRGGGRKRSAAEKHEERVAWIQARVSAVLAHFQVVIEPQGWLVEGAIVTDINVMSPHLAACPLPVYALHELQTMLERS